MKYLFFLLFAQMLLAQDTTKIPPAAPISSTESKSILTIDPKARANDYVQAFDLLRKDKPSLKMIVRTTNTLFTGVTDLSVSSGGTLLFVKILSNQGIQTQIVPVEQILEINYSP